MDIDAAISEFTAAATAWAPAWPLVAKAEPRAQRAGFGSSRVLWVHYVKTVLGCQVGSQDPWFRRWVISPASEMVCILLLYDLRRPQTQTQERTIRIARYDRRARTQLKRLMFWGDDKHECIYRAPENASTSGAICFPNISLQGCWMRLH